MKSPKVIGIGFHKTGTTSLRWALELLGYRVTGPNGTDNPRIAGEAKQMAHDLLQQYDAVQDNPWPLLFRDVDRWYPDSLFVLTIRPTEEWLRSTVNYFGQKSTPMREWIYGAGCPRGNEDLYRTRYEKHNSEVMEYFKDRPADLLTIDITRGEGWDKLCPFLGLQPVDRPFPHANPASPRGLRLMAARLRRKWNRAKG